jgi:hypothetical protein
MDQTKLMFESLKIQVHAIKIALTDQQKQVYNQQIEYAIQDLSQTSSFEYLSGNFQGNTLLKRFSRFLLI